MKTARVSYINENFALANFNEEFWKNCEDICINRYWSGKTAESQRHFTTKFAWTDRDFFVHFTGSQHEPLIVNSKPQIQQKTDGLWERDVFEIFVAPDGEDVSKYFEFEVAPTGEWLDLAIEITHEGRRQTDFTYHSGMQSAVLIEPDKISATLKINWQAFGKTPNRGDVWRGNLFRCMGAGTTRGYLAWHPTETAIPNFHVPEKFGYFEFV